MNELAHRVVVPVEPSADGGEILLASVFYECIERRDIDSRSAWPSSFASSRAMRPFPSRNGWMSKNSVCVSARASRYVAMTIPQRCVLRQTGRLELIH